MWILVAEDNEADIGLYRAALASRGHKLVIVKDGRECLKKYPEREFDVVIIDHKIPSINGLQVAKQILSINPNQRIIFASAVAEEILGSIELRNLVKVLPKPFEPDEIIKVIEDETQE